MSSISDLGHIIREFILLDVRPNVEILHTHFKISYFGDEEGAGYSFGGNYVTANNENIPIDLHKIGKAKCRQFLEEIKSFCENYVHTKKWNVLEIQLGPGKSISYNFCWEKIE